MAETLNALDKLFFQLETPTTPMHVGCVLEFAGGDAGDRLARMRQWPVSARPFDRRASFPRRPLAAPCWEQVTDVDLAAHVDACRVPSPPTAEQLMGLVSDLHTVPVPRDRPLWQARVIEGLAGDRFALYFKVHHACIDGVSGIRRIQAALSDTAGEETVPVWAREPARRAPRSRRPPRPAAPLLGGARAIPELVRAMASVGLGAVRGDDTRTRPPFLCPNTPLNPMVSGQRSVAWRRLPFERVRAIGAATGATVNEVALAVCSTVIRELLLDMNALPSRPLVAMVPFSLRGDDAGGGNDVSCILCNLATHLADPAARLATIVASSTDGKAMLRAMSRESAAAYWIAVGLPAILAQAAGLARVFPLPFNVVVSNVPGPRSTLYYDGAELQAIYPASLLFERQALNVTLVSYRGHLDVGLLACRRTIPDLPRLARRLDDALVELERATVGSAS